MVVVGGTIAGVAAAVTAASAGASVFLVAPRPYLGEDMCATLRLWLDEDEEPAGPLTEAIFGAERQTTPMRVKKALDGALLDAGVDFLLGCYATGVLRDGAGMPAGITMVNRAGRQAIEAKVLVDATHRGWVARMAGAGCHPWPAGKLACRRIVLGGTPTTHEPAIQEIPCVGIDGYDGALYREYLLELSVPGGDFVSLACAEQEARDRTRGTGQLRASESLFYIPPDPVVGRLNAGQWPGLGKAALPHCRPDGVDRLYLVSGAADVPRDKAERLLRPTESERLGELVGKEAAGEALGLPSPTGVHAPGQTADGHVPGEVREVLTGLRAVPSSDGAIAAEKETLPILAEYDVVVVGGGTSGACAAIAAARRGCRVLVTEYQEGLGGTGTLGLIGKPYHGQRIGFGATVPFPDETFTVDDKIEWYRSQIRQAGGDIWLGALGCGAVVDGSRVTGAVLATPAGRGIVLGKVIIDATGNADVAVAAGAESMYGEVESDLAMQGAGLPLRPLGQFYVNTDYLLVDEADAVDTWRALVGARQAMRSDVYDAGSLIQTRERRRVVGDHVLLYLDQIAGRTYPDSIVFSASDYDSHGYPTQPFFALLPQDEASRAANHPAPGGSCYTPYRCLLPRGLDGILVTGLGISMERDASAMMRMQHDVHNQGYAAGVAAAMAVSGSAPPRAIDVRALQKHLVETGNLSAEVLTHEDSFPLPAGRLHDAVDRLAVATNPKEAGDHLAVILSHPETVLPLLRRAYHEGCGRERLLYAGVLAFLGEGEVVPLLIEALDGITVWDDRILQGIAAEYAHLPTPIDTLILALGATVDPRALPAILRKLETLDATVTLSHHRAVALALERLGDPAAAEPLARLLGKPGMGGHAMTEVEPLHNKEKDRRRRLGPLREIVLARALYHCGDHRGLGERTLMTYRCDLRGLLARHATAMLTSRWGLG